MKQPEFRLERVLAVRELRERAGQERLARAASVSQLEHRQLATDRIVCQDGQRYGEARMAEEPAAGDLAVIAGAIEGLQVKRDRQQVVADEADRVTGDRRQELRELWQDREALSRLRQNFLLRSQRERQRRDQAQMDDLALGSRYRR